jgi:hypothetical protein
MTDAAPSSLATDRSLLIVEDDKALLERLARGGRERPVEPARELIELPFARERSGLVPGRCLRRVLPSRWIMSDDACLAHFYYAFWIAFLRNSYHRVFGPCHCPPKFANGLCGHSATWICFDPHRSWQATKR